MRLRRAVLPLAAGLAAGLSGLGMATSAAATSDCSPTIVAADVVVTEPAELELDVALTGAESLELNFDRSRAHQDDSYYLRAKGDLPPRRSALDTIISPFRRSGAGGRIGQDNISAEAVVRDRDTVEVHVCVDPTGAPDGRYEGTVGFADGRVTGAPVRVVATLQYRPWGIAFLAALAAAAAAFIVSFLAASDQGERFSQWSRRPRTIVAGMAAVAAVVGVYLASYNADPDWRFGADALGYMGVAYSAALAALGSFLGAASLGDYIRSGSRTS